MTFPQNIVCDILVIGGGGAGGGDIGGGGGAGGVVYQKGVTIPSGTYNIIVGTGGAANAATAIGTNNSVSGNDGQSSKITLLNGSTLVINGITYEGKGGGGGRPRHGDGGKGRRAASLRAADRPAGHRPCGGSGPRRAGRLRRRAYRRIAPGQDGRTGVFPRSGRSILKTREVAHASSASPRRGQDRFSGGLSPLSARRL